MNRRSLAKLVLYALLITGISATAAAQDCEARMENITRLLAACAGMEADSVCLLEIDTETSTEIAAQTWPVLDYFAEQDSQTIMTVADEETQTFALISIDVADAPMLLLVYGNTSLQNTAPTTTITVRATTGVNMRERPYTNAEIIGSLVRGRDYTAVARTSTGRWLRILLEDRRAGWVLAEYLRSDEDAQSLAEEQANFSHMRPIQSTNISTGDDCSGVLVVGHGEQYENREYIGDFNGAGMVTNGVVWITVDAPSERMTVTNLEGPLILAAHGLTFFGSYGRWTTSAPLDEMGQISGEFAESSDYTGIVPPYEGFVDFPEDTGAGQD